MVVLKLPPVTRSFIFLVLALSLYCMAFRWWNAPADDASPAGYPHYLVLVIGRTPWWAIWTLATTNLVEVQFVPLVIVLAVVATGGRYCEKIWSSRSYLRLIVVSLIASTFIETVLWSCVAELPLLVCGANSLLAGILVALKQMVPSHTIILLRNRVRLQIRWLPLSFLVLVTALSAVGLEHNVCAYYLGFVGSWFFLRFHHETEGIGHGDASDAFSFAQFFPGPLSRLVQVPADRIYALLAGKLGIVRQFTPEEIEDGNQRYAARLAGTLLPKYGKGARVTNERRRIMLQALDRTL